MHLISDAKEQFHRLWSIRVSLFFGVFTGMACVLGAFINVFNPWFLLVISVVVNVALIPLARLMKQADEPIPPTEQHVA